MKTNAIIPLALHLTLTLSQLLPQPDGPYKIQWTNTELVDDTRIDPFNSTHNRRMMISHFTPIPNEQCTKMCTVPYMPREIATIEDEILMAYFARRNATWPAGTLDNLEIEHCCEVANNTHTKTKAKFPTLLLGPGLNTTRLFYSSTGQYLASKGYEVIVMDHPYETDVVQFPDGEIIFGGAIGADPTNSTNYVFGLDVRTADVSFVLDTFNICKTVYIGHSFGGASAIASLLSENRLASGVNLDGTVFGPMLDEGAPRPVLFFGSQIPEEHNSTTDDAWALFFASQDAKHPDLWSRELNVVGSSHSTYGDYSLIADATGLGGDEAFEFFFGRVAGDRAMEILTEYVTDFVEFTLLHEDEGLLAGESPEFPEVIFKR
jgi:pimeloyl-ACP methyl ester carboxylesterase